jgi:hypothetical protein
VAGLLPDPLGKLKRSPRHSSRSWCHGREHSLAHLGALSGEEEGVEVNGRGGDEWEGLLLNLPSPESTSSGQNASLTARLRPDPVAGLNPWSPMPIWLTRSTKGVTNDLLPISKFLDHIWTYFQRLPPIFWVQQFNGHIAVTIRRDRKSEIQDGVCAKGNNYVSSYRWDNNGSSTAIPMFSMSNNSVTLWVIAPDVKSA